MLTFDPKSPATDREVSMHIWIDIWHIARSSLQYCTSPTSYSSHSTTLPCEVLCTTTFACTIGPMCAAKFGQTLPWHAPYAKHFGCECECSMWGVSASVPLTRLSRPSSRAKQAEQTAQQSTVCAINYAKFLPPTPTAARPPHLAPPLASELLLNNCANFQFMFLLVMVATPTRQQAGRLAVDTNRFVY